jgi:hypothetical protein
MNNEPAATEEIIKPWVSSKRLMIGNGLEVTIIFLNILCKVLKPIVRNVNSTALPCRCTDPFHLNVLVTTGPSR